MPEVSSNEPATLAPVQGASQSDRDSPIPGVHSQALDDSDEDSDLDAVDVDQGPTDPAPLPFTAQEAFIMSVVKRLPRVKDGNLKFQLIGDLQNLVIYPPNPTMSKNKTVRLDSSNYQLMPIIIWCPDMHWNGYRMNMFSTF
jgi:hypothetical protein